MYKFIKQVKLYWPKIFQNIVLSQELKRLKRNVWVWSTVPQTRKVFSNKLSLTRPLKLSVFYFLLQYFTHTSVALVYIFLIVFFNGIIIYNYWCSQGSKKNKLIRYIPLPIYSKTVTLMTSRGTIAEPGHYFLWRKK